MPPQNHVLSEKEPQKAPQHEIHKHAQGDDVDDQQLYETSDSAVSSNPSTNKRRRTEPKSAFSLLMKGGSTSQNTKRKRTTDAAPSTRGTRTQQSSGRPTRTIRNATSSPNPSTSAALQPRTPTPSPTRQMPVVVHHRSGDLFSALAGSVLIHACNCRGSWGAGVALAFKKKYPLAFRIYADHCRQHFSKPERLVGTTLLIPPQREGKGRQTTDWVACLFTRENYGKPPKGKTQKQDVEEILEATGRAWRDLLGQVRGCEGRGEEVGEIVMPRINGGLFRVPWERTVGVLRGGGGGWDEGMRRECWVYGG